MLRHSVPVRVTVRLHHSDFKSEICHIRCGELKAGMFLTNQQQESLHESRELNSFTLTREKLLKFYLFIFFQNFCLTQSLLLRSEKCKKSYKPALNLTGSSHLEISFIRVLLHKDAKENQYSRLSLFIWRRTTNVCIVTSLGSESPL